MKITVLSVTVNTVPTAKGSYQKLELAFKGEDGQVKGKNVMSFGAAANAFKVLSKAQAGEVYDITAIKNDTSGYWDWTGATKVDATSGGANSSTTAPANPASKSTYETAEERARKQVYIVRQSSVANAISFHAGGPAVEVSDIIATAKQFETYVFDLGTTPSAEFVGDEEEVL